MNELIDYYFLDGQLGGKPDGAKLYDAAGAPMYERFRAREGYKAGLARLLWLIARKDVICIMCAEEKPETCHRKLLIAPDLAVYGVRVSHIRAARILHLDLTRPSQDFSGTDLPLTDTKKDVLTRNQGNS